MDSNPVILITGCSSGLGHCLAEEALTRGMRVVATARRLPSIHNLSEKGAKTFVLDVTSSSEELQGFAQKAIAAFGQVDILINNAGWLLGGAVEEDSPAQILSQFNTNFFSIINITNAFLPHFRERRTATIVNISSQGAYMATPGAGVYSASKAALDSITETWAKELAPWNIRATAVNLGAFRTSVAGSNTQHPERTIDGYDAAHQFLSAFQERSGKELGDAAKGAKKLLDVITLKTDKPLPPFLPLGEDSIHIIKHHLEKRLVCLEQWKEYALGTNVDGETYQDAGW